MTTVEKLLVPTSRVMSLPDPAAIVATPVTARALVSVTAPAVLRLSVVAEIPATPAVVLMSMASASVNVTVWPAALMARKSTSVFASVTLMVPDAVRARLVSMMPPAVPVMAPPVIRLTVATPDPLEAPGVTSELMVMAPAVPSPMVRTEAVML